MRKNDRMTGRVEEVNVQSEHIHFVKGYGHVSGEAFIDSTPLTGWIDGGEQQCHRQYC